MIGIIVGRDQPVRAPEQPQLRIGPAPRNVKLRARAGKRLRMMRMVAVGSFLVGVWMTWSMLKGPLTHAFGKTATAKVVTVSHVAGDKLSRWFDVKFSYETGGDTRHFGYGTIDMAGDAPPLVGAGIAVKVFGFFPFRHAILKDDGGGFAAVAVGLLLIVFCLMAAGLAVYVWARPAAQRKLMRDGNGAVGTVVQKASRQHFGLKQHVVWYRFSAENGESWVGQTRLVGSHFSKLVEGETVSVIYQGGKPWKSVLYEEADFEEVKLAA